MNFLKGSKEAFTLTMATPKMPRQQRRKFTNVEDQILLTLVNQLGTNSWNQVASKMLNRTPKQCKDRYLHFLLPGYSKDPFTKEEDEIIVKQYLEYGPKWTKMTAMLSGRSANSIKNRWNYCLSKQAFFFTEAIQRDDDETRPAFTDFIPDLMNDKEDAELFFLSELGL